jgi:hypothetical protein
MKNTCYPIFDKWVKISIFLGEIMSNVYKNKTENISHNFWKNIFFPIISILAVQSFHKKINFCEILASIKKGFVSQ